MNIEEVRIQNFRALRDVTVSLSNFNCIIGANNAGKSSVLHAIQAFMGTKNLPETDFHNPGVPVKVTVKAAINDKDLEAVVEQEHRERIKSIGNGGIYTLTYTASAGQKPRLTRTGYEPKDAAWKLEALDKVMEGKKGADLKAAVETAYPALSSAIGSASPPPKAQKDFREIFFAHVQGFSPDALTERDDLALPTGIDASVKALFPDVIFVPAVRDVAEDVKTADKAAFGKLIGLLLNSISGEIANFKTELAKLDEMLNIKLDGSGKPKDGRLAQVKDLESTVQGYLQESFPSVSVKLNIPPPEPKLILQGGRIDLDDSVAGPVETKGDGLKRAVIFSLLRAYSDLSKRPEWNPNASPGKHLLMFEEPEIFLHPTAQKLLFEALDAVSGTMQVIVTTHSPLFFSASRTNAFSKLVKVRPKIGRPFSELVSIDFQKKLDLKTQFQVLCYENHNAAFFAEAVVLVEGDSDLTVLQHAARLLDPEWDFEEGRVRLVKVGGKGNFARFSDFFSHFRIQTLVVTDLDSVVTGFGDLPLAADSPVKAAREQLIAKAIPLCPEYQADAEQTNTTWRAAGARLRGMLPKVSAGQALDPEDLATLDWMDGKLGKNRALTATLATNADLEADKRALLEGLRSAGIIVWEKGSIESYYPFPVNLERKTEAADRFRREVATKDDLVALAQAVPNGPGGAKNEFLAAFERLFSPTAILSFSTKDLDGELELPAQPAVGG